jgi:hypothetical protein
MFIKLQKLHSKNVSLRKLSSYQNSCFSIPFAVCFSFQQQPLVVLLNNTRYYKSIEITSSQVLRLMLVYIIKTTFFGYISFFFCVLFTVRLCNWASWLNLKILHLRLRSSWWVSLAFISLFRNCVGFTSHSL